MPPSVSLRLANRGLAWAGIVSFTTCYTLQYLRAIVMLHRDQSTCTRSAQTVNTALLANLRGSVAPQLPHFTSARSERASAPVHPALPPRVRPPAPCLPHHHQPLLSRLSLSHTFHPSLSPAPHALTDPPGASPSTSSPASQIQPCRCCRRLRRLQTRDTAGRHRICAAKPPTGHSAVPRPSQAPCAVNASRLHHIIPTIVTPDPSALANGHPALPVALYTFPRFT